MSNAREALPNPLCQVGETPVLIRTTADATRAIALANIVGIRALPDEYTQFFTYVTIFSTYIILCCTTSILNFCVQFETASRVVG